jgi:ATP-dependent DNA helicase RecQ
VTADRVAGPEREEPKPREHRGELQRLAAEKFGWELLRDEQLEAMEAVMSGHDVLAVLPTGSGKSAIYQVPALLLDAPPWWCRPSSRCSTTKSKAWRTAGLPKPWP